MSSRAARATTTSSPTVFAPAQAGAVTRDDITVLDGQLYVTFQNNAGPDDSPVGSRSTVVALDATGHRIAMWSLAGLVDGGTADRRGHRVLATANEDLNSSLYVITAGAKARPTSPTAPTRRRRAATD